MPWKINPDTGEIQYYEPSTGGGGGGGSTNLTFVQGVNNGVVVSDSGTDALIPLADGTNAGLISAAEKSKLAGIQAGAEVNVNSDWNASSGDAQILNKPTALPPNGSAGGDLTGSYPNPTLAASGVTAGDYGSATQVPVITIDSKGRITAAGSTSITGTPPGGNAGGDLTGTYPNPTVHRVHGVDFQNGTPADGDVWNYDNTNSRWKHSALTPSNVGLGNVPNVDATNPANIVQTSSYRFVTDAEKATWNASTSSLIPTLTGNEVFRGVTFRAGSTTIDTLGGITNNLSGTQGANTVATTNFRTRQVTMRFEPSVVSTGNYCCMRSSTALWSITGGFLFVGEFGISDSGYAVGTHNFWGLTSSTTNLAIGTVSNSQPSALTNIIALANDSGDANLQIMHNDASGTATKIDLGSSFPSNRTSGAALTSMYHVMFYNAPGTSEVVYRVENKETGVVVEGTITTDLPASSTLLAYQAGRSMGTSGGGVSGSGRYDVSIVGVYNI